MVLSGNASIPFCVFQSTILDNAEKVYEMEPFKVMPYVNISLVLYQEMALYLGLYFLLLFFFLFYF